MPTVTAFPMQDFEVRRSSFLNSPVEVLTSRGMDNHKKGCGVSLRWQEAIRASIGEFIERTTLTSKPVGMSGDSLPAFDYTTFEMVRVPIDMVLLLDSYVMSMYTSEPRFCDSSGTATHGGSSHQVIDAAFREYFERQCLVYNWLSRSPAPQVIVQQLGDRQISDMYARTFSYFDEVYVFDISIDDRIVVALTIATGKHYMAVGLSAHWSTSRAVRGSLREILQAVVDFRPKRAPGGTLTREDVFGEFSIEDFGNVLLSDFYRKYRPSSLLDEFRYLFSGHYVDDDRPDSTPIIENYHETLCDIAERLGIRLWLCHIPSVLSIPGVRTVKFVSPDGYPHIKADLINPLHYSISNLNESLNFPNQGRPIPFS